MGGYCDLVIEIRSDKSKILDDYLRSDDKLRVLYPTKDIRQVTEGETKIYVWMGDHQLRVSNKNLYFSIENELEWIDGLSDEDYFAEMWNEDEKYEKCGKLSPSYTLIKNISLFDHIACKWL